MEPPTASPESALLPDLLLDGDRLNVLLEIICADYITASYASRENGKKVILKSLEKLYLSVNNNTTSMRNAAGSGPASASATGNPTSDAANEAARQAQLHAAFLDRARIFYEELMIEFRTRQQLKAAGGASRASFSEADTGASVNTNGRPSSLSLPSPLVVDDSLVKDVLKPKLLQMVEELCKDKDRGHQVGGSMRSLYVAGSSSNGSNANLVAGAAASTAPSVLGSHAQVPLTGEIRMEGWLRKKGQHVTLWRERYFMIRSTPNGSHYLCYYRKKGDKDPRGYYVLGPGTTVDEVRESPSKIETKKLFTFRIRHLTQPTAGEDLDDTGTPHPLISDSSPLVTHTPGGYAPLSPSMSTRITASQYEFPSSPENASGVISESATTEFDPRASMKKISSRRFRSRAAAAAAAATAATAVVLTGGLAGVGIGMGMGMSAAAAAASAGAAGAMMAQRTKGPIALAAESLETAEWWRNSILECIAQAEEQWKRYLNWYMDKENDELEAAMNDEMEHSNETGAGAVSSHGRPRTGSFGTVPRSIAKTFRTSATFSQETSWKLYDFSSTIRVDVERTANGTAAGGAVQLASLKTPPALRTSMKVSLSPRKVVDLLLKTDSAFYSSNHIIQEARVLEDHTPDHNDIVYWRLHPTYLWPCHVEPRDLCLLRYWRKEEDNSYFVCFQSTTHADCPSARSTGSIRASMMGGGFIISPRVHAEEHFEECWVTLTVQMNPNGWLDTSVARSWHYVHAFGARFLEMITCLNALGSSETPRPLSYAGSVMPTNATGTSIICRRSSSVSDDTTSRASQGASQLIVSEIPFPVLEPFRTDLTLQHSLPTKFWSEPDAKGFLIRGPQYLSTRGKRPSARQVLRLVSTELYHAKEPVEHIGLSSFTGPGFDKSVSPTGTSHDQPPLLIINFQIPGTPRHSLVLYFTPENPAELQKNSALADLWHEFFYSASDEFRSKRLKIIPRVVQGTWPIREGVGTTPTILGTKIYQKYFQGGRRYLEIDYDIGSSTVASGICNLLRGFSRDLIIDLAFVIEAQTSIELPERVLACVRLDCIDLRHAVPFTKPNKD